MTVKAKILVTGASGQFGRRLIRELIKFNYKIRAHYRSQEKADKYCPDGGENVLGDVAHLRDPRGSADQDHLVDISGGQFGIA